MSAPAATATETPVIAIAGQPNVGKSTLFNALTGLRQAVGHWPGKTVERREGDVITSDGALKVIDLPGAYSLSAASEEEVIARSFILESAPNLVLALVDASAIERSLAFLAELVQLDAPLVVALTMIDVATANGAEVEPEVLAAALGVPVVAIDAPRGQGLDALLSALHGALKEPPRAKEKPEVAEGHAEEYAALVGMLEAKVPAPYKADYVALKLFEGDAELLSKAEAWLGPKWGEAYALLQKHEDAVLDVIGARYAWVARMVRAAVKEPQLGPVTVTDKIDKLAVHPIFGLVLFVLVVAGIFFLTFNVGGPLQDAMDEYMLGPIGDALGSMLASRETVMVDGQAVPADPGWLHDFVTEGLMDGVGTLLTFIPILVIFFLCLGILEDCGYMARIAFIMDRFMHLIGLHGKSFIPLLLGSGCNVPAVTGARVIDSKRGRLTTMLLVPFIPCSARYFVLAFMCPLFFGDYATIAAVSFVAGTLLVIALVGLASRFIFGREREGLFVMELPLYHMPNFKTIGLFVWTQLLHFLKRTATVIVVLASLLWVLTNFPEDSWEGSYLGQFAASVESFTLLLGFNGKLFVGLMGGFVAKEVAISSLAQVYGAPEEAGLDAVLQAQVSVASAVSYLVVTMLFLPCVGTLGALRAEAGWKWVGISILLHSVLAFGGGMIAYQVALALGAG